MHPGDSHPSKLPPEADSNRRQPTRVRLARLLRQVSQAQGAEVAELRQEAAQLWQELQHAPATRGARRPREAVRSADDWMADIYRATERAIPRETLLLEFIRRWNQERRAEAPAPGHGAAPLPGPWLFHFQVVSEGKTVVAVEGLTALGTHPDAFSEYCTQHLPLWREDPFLAPVLERQEDLDGWHALWLNPSPLFEKLIDTQQHMGGEPDYWVNAVALPGDGRYETQGLFLCYANPGSPFEPEPPAVLRQDQRLLATVQLAWRQLQHQVKSLAALSESDRRDLVLLIAPGLMHHEIGATMETLYAQAYEQFQLLRPLAQAESHAQGPLHLAARYAHTLASHCLRLQKVTHAFNNLDKRGAVEASTPETLLTEVRLLLTHRLGALGVDWHVATESEQITWLHRPIRTDVVLLQQALLNILNNAMNALEESQSPAPRRILTRLKALPGERLSFECANNGPAIPEHLREDIFRRGYSTRARGHGQGLYLVRLIANYLGGEAGLVPPSELPIGFQVGFFLSFSQQLPTQQGVRLEAN